MPNRYHLHFKWSHFWFEFNRIYHNFVGFWLYSIICTLYTTQNECKQRVNKKKLLLCVFFSIKMLFIGTGQPYNYCRYRMLFLRDWSNTVYILDRPKPENGERLLYAVFIFPIILFTFCGALLRPNTNSILVFGARNTIDYFQIVKMQQH